MSVQYQVIIEITRNLVRLKHDISFRDHKFISSGYTKLSFVGRIKCGSLNRGLRLIEIEKAAKEAKATHIPRGFGCGCKTDVAWWTNTLLLLIAKRIRCQKACNCLATHPFAKAISAKASRAQVRWRFAEASNAV